MGLDISGIMVANKVKLDDYKGKAIALDGYNVLYQFLSSIRGPDGTPLQDDKGRITSHLSGALYRTASLLEMGIKPIYVFDGKPHYLKSSTLAERRARKEKAKIQWDEALAEGDMEKARTKAQQTSKLTRDMVDEAIVLLNHMGVPTLKAPEEGEAQASYMALKGDVHASGSQDFDSLLFADTQDEPTEEQILKHFEKYKNYFPDQISPDNPYGFGYKLPDSVRLEYIAVKLDDVAETVTRPIQEDIESFYQRNRERFAIQVPSDPNDPNSPLAPAPNAPDGTY